MGEDTLLTEREYEQVVISAMKADPRISEFDITTIIRWAEHAKAGAELLRQMLDGYVEPHIKNGEVVFTGKIRVYRNHKFCRECDVNCVPTVALTGKAPPPE